MDSGRIRTRCMPRGSWVLERPDQERGRSCLLAWQRGRTDGSRFAPDLDEPELSGPLHRLFPAGRAELAVDALGVALDRVERNVERRADFPQRELARQETEHGQFAVRQVLRGSASNRARRSKAPLGSRKHLDEDPRVRAALDGSPGLADDRACLVVLTEVMPDLCVREERVADLGLGGTSSRKLHGTPDVRLGLVELASLLERLAAGDVGHRVRPVILETALVPELDGGTGKLCCRVPLTALGVICGEAAVRVDDREVVAGRDGAPNGLLERRR